MPRTPRERGGRRRRGSAGGELPDCVKSRRAAVVLALAPTVADLSSLFQDFLRLLQSGLVRTFLSEGECRDVASGTRPESRTCILIYAKERREVLGRIGGGGRPRQGEATETPVGGSPAAYNRGATARRSELSKGTR